MNVSKLLVGSTLLLVIGILVGSLYYPNAAVMNFAATSEAYNVVRVVLAGLLVGLLVSHPPRSLSFRVALGAWAVLLAILSTYLLLSYRINLLDIVVFIELSIIFGLEALETGAAPASERTQDTLRISQVTQ